MKDERRKDGSAVFAPTRASEPLKDHVQMIRILGLWFSHFPSV